MLKASLVYFVRCVRAFTDDIQSFRVNLGVTLFCVNVFLSL